MKLIITAILIILLIFIVIVPLFYFKFGFCKKFYHDLLGWHQPNEKANTDFDGCSLHATCKYCHKEIMQDSQGNWF